MLRTMLKSKIHRATVTGANMNYEGSIAIDKKLCKASNILPFERVEIYNINNGNRFSTYVIHGDKGEISLNGAAARMVQPGDLIIIATYSDYSEEELEKYSPQIVFVNGANKIIPLT